ncbi:MAG: N-acetyltransferase [Okeania sp. SIO2G4]|uniref:GNAT family N-acetyltransferase n=1 Tax=unclassified Okeania TaxID=2634635 RepID=UPI0013B6ECFD|nr:MULTISPECIES: GNAT family N-acetyltransferase [unclassified Okeania]NEP03871.1 N-acetyltransferase [Okeania sp. SIO4D6]NEP42610.1 N-acetyltransferase [Okeania sp. SIO2H7]NEP73078.1 N-acetyltransferase [Okeania sp. SIO2G5]NEP93966.1 N-acetyltransferase [Okeania sp. SIO2F5]NEQ93828.1 N-acetyltransferase [Okeania sp. SIO2G4]
MKIRNAEEKDLDVIVEIYNASIPSRIATGDIECISVESRISWYQEHKPDSRPIWVIELDEKIVGWLSFQSFYGRAAYKATAEVSIYIAPEYKGKGIGKKLLSEAIFYSPKLGINTLLGFIFAHNQPSLKLFDKFGFQRWGYLPKVANLDGMKRDVVILGLHIEEAKKMIGFDNG